MNVFAGVGEIVESSLNLLQTSTLNDKFITLQTTISILITLNIMYKGYMTLAGKSSDPIRELVWDIARKLFILTFVLNVNGWLTMANEALRGLYEWAGNSSTLYAKLDEIAGITHSKIVEITRSMGVMNGYFSQILLILVIVIVFAVIVFQYFFSIITTSLTNTILILVFPIALMCFMFEKTKQVFSQWANMFLANLITLALLTFIADLVSSGLINSIDVTIADKNYYKMAFHTLFTGASIIMLIMMVKGIAKALANVSLDDASTGAMKMVAGVAGGGAGFMLGKSLGGAGIAGKLAKSSMNAGIDKFAQTKSQFKTTLSKLRNGINKGE